MGTCVKLLGRIAREDDGQDLAEYGLLAALISVVAGGAVVLLSPVVFDLWDTAVATITDALSFLG